MTTDSGSRFDAREFRSALGSFATGVTVVTTRGESGEAVGLTVNSFNSVSLQPPLVLWSLVRTSPNLDAFSKGQHWVVHVLAADQEPLSKRFATRGIDKFAGLEYDTGLNDMPLLRGCAARFQCRTAFQYDGGDHVIFVGEVLGFDHSAAAPLVFHDGRYALALPKQPHAVDADMQLTGSFSKDYLGYLLGRGHYLLRRRQRQTKVVGEPVSDDEYFVLSALAVHERMVVSELETAVGDLLAGRFDEVLQGLQAQGHVRLSADTGGERQCELEGSGRQRALQRIAVAKAFEAQVIEHFGDDNTFVLKTLLRQLIGTMVKRDRMSEP